MEQEKLINEIERISNNISKEMCKILGLINSNFLNFILYEGNIEISNSTMDDFQFEFYKDFGKNSELIFKKRNDKKERRMYVQMIIEERKDYIKKMQEINEPDNPKYICYEFIEQALDDLIHKFDRNYKIRDEIKSEIKQRLTRKFKELT